MEEERAARDADVDGVVAGANLAQRSPPPEVGLGGGRRRLHLRRVRRAQGQEEGEEQEVPAGWSLG